MSVGDRGAILARSALVARRSRPAMMGIRMTNSNDAFAHSSMDLGAAA
jgi:hypothetical protein